METRAIPEAWQTSWASTCQEEFLGWPSVQVRFSNAMDARFSRRVSGGRNLLWFTPDGRTKLQFSRTAWVCRESWTSSRQITNRSSSIRLASQRMCWAGIFRWSFTASSISLPIKGSDTVHDWEIKGQVIDGFVEFGVGFLIATGQKVKLGKMPVQMRGCIPVRSPNHPVSNQRIR